MTDRRRTRRIHRVRPSAPPHHSRSRSRRAVLHRMGLSLAGVSGPAVLAVVEWWVRTR